MNLDWKLALVARDLAPDDLLETYHTEQHAAGTRLLRNSRAQAVFSTAAEDGDEQRLAPLHELLAELAEIDETAGHLAETFTAVGTRHPVRDPSDHPWEGRTVPNVPLRRRDRLTTLTETGGGVLLLDGETETDRWKETAAPWTDRVVVSHARSGELPGAYAVLVRPDGDGHAAWVGVIPAPAKHDTGRLSAVLHEWFGPPQNRPELPKATTGRGLHGRTPPDAGRPADAQGPGPEAPTLPDPARCSRYGRRWADRPTTAVRRSVVVLVDQETTHRRRRLLRLGTALRTDRGHRLRHGRRHLLLTAV